LHFRASLDSTVRRLSGLDGGFLGLEMPGQPMHCLAVSVLRTGISGSFSLHDLRRHLITRLESIPAFRWRVVPVPFGLAQPVLVEDPHFDIDNHLFHTVLPAPGGPGELDAVCARLASRPLHRDRPLWRMSLVDGLTHSRQAIVLEIHHALMDGVALRTALARIFAQDQPEVSSHSGRSARMPTRGDLITGGLAHNARTLARLPELISRTRRANTAVRQHQAAAAVTVPKGGVDLPRSPITPGGGPERRFARAVLPLETVLAVKDAAGVTVNDLALALVSGALRACLQAREIILDQSLVAFIPVSRTESELTPREVGNRFAWLTTTLATDVADPWERLAWITAVTAEAKRCLDLTGRELMADWLEYFPPMLADPIIRRAQKARNRPGKRRGRIGENVVVSNLRGPATPWQLRSAVVEEVYLAGPLNGDNGVNVALWDYAGQLQFGIFSTADLVDNPEELARGLSHSLAELATGRHRISR
jgi:diacylglycerol O-acyltransferase / wax synthase